MNIPELIANLKQSNVSVDNQKTKDRVFALWKACSRTQKHAIKTDAGVTSATLNRIYKVGTISAKIVVPMAYHFDVDPYYLTGETDEQGTACTDDMIYAFVDAILKKNAPEEKPTPAKRGRKPKADKIETAEKTERTERIFAKTPRTDTSAFSAEELAVLMNALLLREKAGSADAKQKADALRALLLS